MELVVLISKVVAVQDGRLSNNNNDNSKEIPSLGDIWLDKCVKNQLVKTEKKEKKKKEEANEFNNSSRSNTFQFASMDEKL